MTFRSATLPLVLAVAASTTACKRPPTAPEGLDASSKYMVRNFFAEDLTFGAGLQGFLDWFRSPEGQAIADGSADNTAYEVSTLEKEDVAYLPLNRDKLLAEPNAEEGTEGKYVARDLTLAPGVVSVSLMDCDWEGVEELLVRPDQHIVFDKDWEAYERTYVSSRAALQDAASAGEFLAVDEPLTPYTTDYEDPLNPDFDIDAWASAVLFTDNLPDPAVAPLVGNLPAFPLVLDVRHGLFDLDSDGDGETEENRVFSILTFTPDAYWGDEGKNGFLQNFSIELNVERSDGQVLRLLSIWNQPDILGVDPTSTPAIAIARNKSDASSQRLKERCEGALETPPEP